MNLSFIGAGLLLVKPTVRTNNPFRGEPGTTAHQFIGILLS